MKELNKHGISVPLTYLIPETYSELGQVSLVKFFAERVSGFPSLPVSERSPS